MNYFFGKDSENDIVGERTSKLDTQVNGAHGFGNTGAGSGINASTGPIETFGAEFEESFGGGESLNEREFLECELIRRLIISYFGIVRESIQDQIPKAVMHLLVNFSKESAQTRLVSKLYKESLFKELLHEDEQLAQERKSAKTCWKHIKKRQRLLVRSFKHILLFKESG